MAGRELRSITLVVEWGEGALFLRGTSTMGRGGRALWIIPIDGGNRCVGGNNGGDKRYLVVVRVLFQRWLRRISYWRCQRTTVDEKHTD